MARYYKTAQANPLDYMYELDVPLMKEVLQTNDKMITGVLGGADQVGTLASQLKYISTPEETEAAKRIMSQFENKAEELASEIQKDPANWRKKMGDLRGLSAELKKEFTSGEASKLQANYEAYKKWTDDIDKAEQLYIKSGGKEGIDPVRAARKKALALNNFKGTNYKENGEYELFQGSPILPNIDFAKMISADIDKLIKSGKVTKTATAGGGYIFSEEDGEKGMSFDRLFAKVMANYRSNPLIEPYFREMEELGLVSGITHQQEVKDEYGNIIHEKGSMIQPYEFVEKPMLESEKLALEKQRVQINQERDPIKRAKLQEELTQMEEHYKNRKAFQWNPDSHLGNIMRDVITSSQYVDEFYKQDLKSDGTYTAMKGIEAANARAQASLNLRERIHTENMDYRKAKDAQARKDAIRKDPNLSEKEKTLLLNEEEGLEVYMSTPQNVFNMEEARNLAKEYNDLTRKEISKMTSEERARWKELDIMFQKVADYVPEGMSVSDFIEARNYAETGQFSESTLDRLYQRHIPLGGDITPENRRRFEESLPYLDRVKINNAASLLESKERRRLRDINKKIEEHYKTQGKELRSLAEVMSEELKVHDIFHSPVAGTRTGDAIFSYLDQVFATGTNKAYYRGDTKVYTKDGNLKPSDYPDVDKYMQQKESLTENLTDILWQMNGNDIVVKGNVKQEEFKGKPIQVVLTGAGTESLTTFLEQNKGFQTKEAKKILEKANPRIAKISNAVSHQVATLMYPGQQGEVHGVKIKKRGDGTYDVTLPGQTEAVNKVVIPVKVTDQYGRVTEQKKEVLISSPALLEAIVDKLGN